MLELEGKEKKTSVAPFERNTGRRIWIRSALA